MFTKSRNRKKKKGGWGGGGELLGEKKVKILAGEEALKARENPGYHIIDAWRSVSARGRPGHDAKTGKYEELQNTKQHDFLPFLKLQ